MKLEKTTICPLCNGSKVSPLSHCECKTCNGEGIISLVKLKAIRRIQENIKKKLSENHK